MKQSTLFKIRLAFVLFTVSLLVTTTSLAQSTKVTVYPEQVIGTISPLVYGANFGPLSVIVVDLFPQASASGIQFLRFPGGRWGDQNDIRPVQIDVFMKILSLVGAEPLIHARLENGTPEAAAELVQHTNIENDYNVRYWSIGNEPNLFDDYTVEDLNREWRPIAEAMLEVDPSIVLIGPDVSQWNGIPDVLPPDINGEDWLTGFLEVNGDLIDVVSIHRYPFPRSMANPITTIPEMRANIPEWGELIPRLRQVVEESTGRTDLRLAITEASSHWSNVQFGEATPDSHFHAIWWAAALGQLIEDGVDMVNYYELQTLTDRGGWGMLEKYDVRPAYYVYQLFQHFGDQRIAIESTHATAYTFAARHEDTVTLIFVNPEDDNQNVDVILADIPDPQVTKVQLFDPDHQAVEVDLAQVGDEHMLSLPPQSMLLLEIEIGE